MSETSTAAAGALMPGIFETVFPRPSLDERLDAVLAAGVRAIQLDLESAGLGSLPATIPAETATMIRQAITSRGIVNAGVGGMYNMIDPDEAARATGLANLGAIIAAAPTLGTNVVTLCTGTRNRDSMWRGHPDNATSAAWADLRAAMDVALARAAAAGVTLGIEPEPANVIANARAARRLLDEVGDAPLKIVLDPANIVAGDLERDPADSMREAFDLLGDDIVIGHAKDIDAGGDFCAAGTGIVPWQATVALFRQAGYAGPLVLHTVTEADAPRAIAFLDSVLAGE